MSQIIHSKLYKRTVGNIEISKKTISMLNELKDQIPYNIYSLALTKYTKQMKQYLASHGYSQSKQLQKLFDNMGSKKFNLMKILEQLQADLYSYYQVNEHGNEQQQEDLIEESPIRKLTKKTRVIKKNKRGKQAKPKVQTQIYEQSMDQVQNFMIV